MSVHSKTGRNRKRRWSAGASRRPGPSDEVLEGRIAFVRWEEVSRLAEQVDRTTVIVDPPASMGETRDKPGQIGVAGVVELSALRKRAGDAPRASGELVPSCWRK